MAIWPFGRGRAGAAADPRRTVRAEPRLRRDGQAGRPRPLDAGAAIAASAPPRAAGRPAEQGQAALPGRDTGADRREGRSSGVRNPDLGRDLAPPIPAGLHRRTQVVRLDGVTKQAMETGRTRLVVGMALFALVFIVLGGRVVHLGVTGGGTDADPHSWAGFAEKKANTPALSRRSITDRNGVLIATNLPTASLYVDAREVIDADELAQQLVQVLPDLSYAEVKEKAASGRAFSWLKRNLTRRQQAEVHELGIPGLGFRMEEQRVYPHGSLFSHVVGFTDIDNRGISGIELSFDEALSDRARLGKPFALSLDVRVQHALHAELSAAKEKFKALGAGGLVLNVHTGEVMGLVSLPDFDPADPGTATEDQRFNRIALGVYEMGSTMKTLNTAMALDSGKISLTQSFDATKPIYISRFSIRDYHPENRWLTVAEIFEHSSNIGSAKMALELGTPAQKAFLDKLGMLDRPAIELPEVGRPLVPANWAKVETMTIAFGHGLSVTPLQLGRATAAIVNGGILRPLTLVERNPGEPEIATQVISARTSDTMRRLLHLVVGSGTAKKAAVPGYLVGGKTGTSEKVKAGGGYSRKALLTSFVGAFPMNDPEYVVIAVLDEPQGLKETYGYATAGWNAAPTVGRVIARIAPVLGVEPVDEQDPAIREAMFVPLPGGPEKHLAAN